jgi:flagellar hook-length control protein FliK
MTTPTSVRVSPTSSAAMALRGPQSGPSASAPDFAQALGQAVSGGDPAARTPDRPASPPDRGPAADPAGPPRATAAATSPAPSAPTEKAAGKPMTGDVADEDARDDEDGDPTPAEPGGLTPGPVPAAVWAMLAAGLGGPAGSVAAPPAGPVAGFASVGTAGNDAVPAVPVTDVAAAPAGTGPDTAVPAPLPAAPAGTAPVGTGAAGPGPVVVTAGRSPTPATVPAVLPTAALTHSRAFTVLAPPPADAPRTTAPSATAGATAGTDDLAGLPAAGTTGPSLPPPTGSPSAQATDPGSGWTADPGTPPAGDPAPTASPAATVEPTRAADPARTADPAPAGPDPALAPPVPVAPPVAAGVPATTPAPVREGPVAAQLTPQLAVLRSAPDGSHTMTLVITPESLGPVSVRVTVSGGALDLTLHGASAHGRHALTEALPDLRRDLEAAGLTFSRLEVGAGGGGDGPGSRTAQQQLLADLMGNGGQQRSGGSDARPRAWAPPGTHLGEGGPVLTSTTSASSGVDVRA